jgi:hypothetical protein
VEVFEQLMGMQPKRFQKIFEHAAHLDHDDLDFLMLEAGFFDAFGEARTAELLAVSESNG